MNTHIENYLNTVCEQIKCKAAHNAIREELAEHIGELQEAYLAQGEAEEAATLKALTQMGDPREVGRQLHKTHKPQTDWLTLGLLTLLLGFGIIVLSGYQTFLSYNIGTRQAVFTGIGLCIAAVFYFINYTKLLKYSFLLYAIGILLNIHILLVSQGSTSWWFSIGSVTIDAGALVLCCYLLGLAGLAIHWQTERRSDSWLLVAFMVLAIGLLFSHNLAKAFILAIACLPLIHYSVSHAPWCTTPKKQLTIFYGVLAALFLASSFMMIAIEPYRAARFSAFLHPEKDPMGDGYVATQQRLVMEKAQWFQGIPPEEVFYETDRGPHFIVPEAHTDLVFAYIIGRFGWGVAIALCFVMAALICRMFQLSRKIQDSYGKTLCYSITAFFAAQIICNILMNLTLFPYSSISLPFISYGGSMLVLDMVMMAIFLNVYRRKNLINETPQMTGTHFLPRIDIKVTWK
ncbi:MAG: FtsW/RodA/SpoVE family cell cycle protein [Peptococcaceae bacterium]|nr:FtsW/RodA/SpoVE family cell cycle protein [Peptococcaceae bacterium]